MLGRQVTLVLRARRFPTHHVPLNTTRYYATPGRPRKSVGEPSKPVKRAVKRVAVTPDSTTPDSPAAAPRKRAVAAKKAGAKRTTATKVNPTKKKPAVKKKVAVKKVAKKVKPASKTQTAKAEALKIKALKDAALDPPFPAHFNAYASFVKAAFRSHYDSVQATDRYERLSATSKAVSAEYKALGPADIERYNHEARQLQDAQHAECKRWLESHTVEEIRAANSARKTLNRRFPTAKNKTSKWRTIKDERDSPRPTSGFIRFSTERHASGDMANIAIRDTARLISKEWRTLSDAEKENYNGLAREDRLRYNSEHSASSRSSPLSTAEEPQAAAAASA